MNKIIIAGGRKYTNYESMKKHLDKLLSNMDKSEILIICGMANGADKLGKLYGEETGIEVIEMPAEWNKYGKSAGYIRNEEMAKIATHCVCFWDGTSKGTGHMIDLAEKYKLNLRVVKYV